MAECALALSAAPPSGRAGRDGPTSLGVGIHQTSSISSTEGFNPPSTPSWAAHSARPPKIQVVDIIWGTFRRISRYVYRILPTPKFIKSSHFYKTPLKLKMPKWSILDRFWMLFGAPFSIKFRDLLNLLNCNTYNAQISFCLSRHLLFASSHQFTIIISYFFWHCSWSPFCDNLCLFYSKMIDWATLQNPVGAKMADEIDQVAPK